MTQHTQYSAYPQAELEYLVRPPKDQTANPPLLLLMHGVGSNEQDLFSLAQHLPDHFLIVSARGPLTLGPGSYAWFQVNFSSGTPAINYQQAEESRQIILRFIDFLKKHFTFNQQEIYVGGFSQGGIMSYSVGLTEPSLLKGIVVMSGRLLHEVRPQIAHPAALKELNVLIMHGVEDNVLPINYAREARSYLTSKELEADYHEFPGGHSVTNDMIQTLNGWLGQ